MRRVVDQVQSNAALADRLRESGALIARDKAKLLAPILDPGFVLSCGMNYHAHLREMKSPTPETPAHFAKSAAGSSARARRSGSPPRRPTWSIGKASSAP